MKITARTLDSGAIRYQLDLGSVGGRRRRLLYETESEAKAAARRAAALRSRGRLAPPEPRAPTLKTAAERLVASVAARGRAPLTVDSLRARLGFLCRVLGISLRIDAVQGEELARLLASISHPVTRHNAYVALRQLFRFAEAQEWITRNPLRRIPAPTLPRVMPPIWTPDEVGRVLTAADARIIPYLAISLLAGLRPGEVAQLDWVDVDLAEGLILVQADTSKVRRSRFVEVCPRLAGLLEPLAAGSGPVCPPLVTLQRLRSRAVQGIGYSQDVMRHTFATLHLAAYRAPGRTALEMGTSEGMLMRHYRGLIKPDAARDYFGEGKRGPPPG